MFWKRTRSAEGDDLLLKARRRLARMSPAEAREYSIGLWAYGMRIAENPGEHLEDDLGEMDMAIAALRAVRERLAAG